jgi:hypothetical protein
MSDEKDDKIDDKIEDKIDDKKDDKKDDDPQPIWEKYLAPQYPYNKGIVPPEGSIEEGGLGMSSEGSLGALATNIAGLISYGQLLVSGGGKANKNVHEKYGNTNRPLGDRIFVKTPAQCKPVKYEKNPKANEEDDYLKKLPNIDPETYEVTKEKHEVDRYVFIDHIPTGSIPGLGNTPTFRGLVPGVVGNIFQLNPLGVVKAMSAPAYPPCVNLEIETIKFDQSEGGDWTTEDMKHTSKLENHYVNVQDILDMNGCSFKRVKVNGVAVEDNTNPITGIKSQCGVDDDIYDPVKAKVQEYLEDTFDEGFENLFRELKKTTQKYPTINIKNKPIAKIFTTSFGLLLAYLLFKILKKEINI